MTYMMIPGVLERADEVIRGLSFIAPTSALARDALARMLTLRADFRRDR